MVSFSSMMFSSWVKNNEDYWPLSHPSQALLGQFLAITIRHCKFSLPSLDWWKLMITPTMLKIISISIWNPTIPNTWWPKNNVSELSFMSYPPFEWVFTFTCQQCQSCNSFFKIKDIASTFIKILLPNEIILIQVGYMF